MSCQVIALCTGAPVARSHSTVVSRWLVMPSPTRSRTPRSSGGERLGDDLLDVAPDLLRVVLHVPGPRVDVAVLDLADGDDPAALVEDQAAGRGRSLVDGSDVALAHTALPTTGWPRGPARPPARSRGRTTRGRSASAPFSIIRSTGPEMPIAPTVTPRRSSIGAASEASPTTSSSTSSAQPRSSTARSSASSAARSVIVAGRVAGEVLVGQLGRDVAVRGEQDLAHRGRVRGLQRADLERLAAVVGPEHVVDDEHAALVQRPDPDALAAPGRQRVGPVERPRAQLVAVEVGAAHVQERRAELVLAALGVLLDEAHGGERLQDPVHGRLRQPHLARDLDDAEAAVASGQEPEDRRGAFDRLDSCRPRNRAVNRRRDQLRRT